MPEISIEKNGLLKKDTIKVSGARLLSSEEAKTFLTKEERVYKNWWWLCSPGNDFNYTCHVSYVGIVDYHCNTGSTNGGVRPALNINISDSDFRVGDVFMFGGKEFKIISPELAWMHNDDIGVCAFREEWDAPDANVYEASDVKKFIDNWFTTIIKKEK